MAEKKIYYHLDLNGNEIKKAKIPTITDVSTQTDEDAINRGYVKESNKYKSQLAQTLPTSDEVGGINIGVTTLYDKPIQEILDLMLYPIIPAVYKLPTSVLEVSNIDFILPQVGFKTNISLVANVVLNDSKGITNYTFSGDGITTPITQTSNTLVLNDIELKEKSSWEVSINYQESNIKNDSRGVQNTAILPDGVLTSKVVIESNNIFMYGVSYSEFDTTNTNTTSDMLVENMTTFITDNEFEIAIGNTNDAHINIAIPNGYDLCVEQNGINVTNGFSDRLVSDVKPWGQNDALDYKAFYLKIPKTSSDLQTLKVKVKPFETQTLYYLDYNHTTNKISVNGGTETDSWDITNDTPIGGNSFGVKDINNSGYYKIFSFVGTIKEVIQGRPYNFTTDLDFLSVYVPAKKGFLQHKIKSDITKFIVKISNQPPKNGFFQDTPS